METWHSFFIAVTIIFFFSKLNPFQQIFTYLFSYCIKNYKIEMKATHFSVKQFERESIDGW